jgi:ankyrin repeat protein
MSRAITLNLRPHIRFLHKHALVFFSDWMITLTETTSKTFRWLHTLLSTGPGMPNLGVYRHGSRMGWNVFSMKTSHTLQRGFGSTMKIMIYACPLCVWRNLAVPLYHAARLRFCNLAAHLIAEHPEHVNARNDWERTTMHAATAGGNTDILSLLLEHDADVDSRDREDSTSLHWASYYGALSVGQYLLDHGADINPRDMQNWTPLCDAARQGHVEFVQMLLEHGAVIDARDDDGGTALHHAVEQGKIEVARLLLKYGADANARDESGKAPSQYTTQQKILELLSEYGAKPVK